MLFPIERPVTVVFGSLEFVKLPLPETNDQIPDPTVGEFAASVDDELQML